MNILRIHLDFDHHIQIGYFDLIEVEVDAKLMGGFSKAGLTPQTDVRDFASILFEIVVGRPVNGDTFVPSTVPKFVSKIIKEGLWSKSRMQCSFCDIFRILNNNKFQIMEGVDSEEVLAYIKWIESAENPGQ